ncbi:MAG: DUF2911 domain-containing protein [Blastocatellia bacterium]
MKSFRVRFAAILILLVAAAAIVALAQRQRASPHETVELTLNGKKISIVYGRPYAKGRQVMGGLVPYGQVWRTGADEATKLTTEVDLMLGDLHVPKGTYSLFTLPAADGWKLIVNKKADQWGAFSYNQAEDLGRAAMTVKALTAPVEQFTISLAGSGGKGTLKMEWEKASATIAIMAH